jgi:PAS domain S-box-containing protein
MVADFGSELAELSSDYFAALVASSEDAIISVSLDGSIRSFNPTAEQLYGFSAREAVGKSLEIVFPMERKAEVLRAVALIAAGERVGRREEAQLTKEGRRIAVSASYSPIRSQSGSITGMALVVRSNGEAQRDAILYRRLLDALPVGVVLIDSLGTIELANPELERMFGYGEGELLGRSAEILMPVALRVAYPKVRDAYLKDPRPLGLGKNRDLYGLRKDSSEFPIEIGLNGVAAENGTSILSLLVDITERKVAEEHRASSAEIDLQNRRIQEANRLKSEFLANVSHELGTPLNAIIGFAELLVDGSVDVNSSKHKEFIGDILTSGRHLLKLINDVLDLAKTEAGRLDFHPEPADLAQLMREVAAILSATATFKRIQVEVEPDPTLSDVIIDPVRFKQVVYNYLSNALRFTADGGKVVVRTRADKDDWFRLEVEDTGVGIRPVDVGKLFIEFQQLEAGTAKRHGSGLGLALTRRLVEAQGGTVGVCSMPGEGSTFHAVLPRRAFEERIARQVESPQRSVRRGACSVLVVEDDPRNQETLATALSKAGYRVELARNGAEAIALCRERAFDAVTLDLVLPDMNGLDLLEAIRSSGKSQDALVMVVTLSASRNAISGYAVQGVLQKPLEPTALLGALQAAGVGPEQFGDILVVDDDPTALQLMAGTLRRFGYRSISHSSGKNALEDVKKLRPAAVVLDLLMPEMDGFQFLDHFRRVPGHERTPVLIWTIKELTRGEQEALRVSVQSILFKASGAEALLSELQAFLPVPPPALSLPPS